MRFKMIAVFGLMSVLSASQAFAFGGGGGHHSASVGSVGGSAITSSMDSTPGPAAAPLAVTSEPLALFAVGLGLLGARFLRRR